MHLTPAYERDRERVEALAAAVQQATGENVELAYVDWGYTGKQPQVDAKARGIRLEVVKRPEAHQRGLVQLPRRWVVERSFAWASRFFGGWSRITSGCRRPWLGYISSPSPA